GPLLLQRPLVDGDRCFGNPWPVEAARASWTGSGKPGSLVRVVDESCERVAPGGDVAGRRVGGGVAAGEAVPGNVAGDHGGATGESFGDDDAEGLTTERRAHDDVGGPVQRVAPRGVHASDAVNAFGFHVGRKLVNRGDQMH